MIRHRSYKFKINCTHSKSMITVKAKKMRCGQSDGSLTVEAAVLLPLVILVAMAFLQWIRFFQVQEESMRKLNEQVRAISQYGYLAGDIMEDIVLTDLQTLEFPIGITKVKKQFLRQSGMRLFTGRYFQGHDGKGAGDAERNEMRVYLAATGSVYHTRADCTHLKLSIRQVIFKEVEALRNQSGEKYRNCQACTKKEISSANERVYITEEGNRYHLTINCRGLLRRISCSTLSEALEQGRRLCSRCAEREEKEETNVGYRGVLVGVVDMGRSAA